MKTGCKKGDYILFLRLIPTTVFFFPGMTLAKKPKQELLFIPIMAKVVSYTPDCRFLGNCQRECPVLIGCLQILFPIKMDKNNINDSKRWNRLYLLLVLFLIFQIVVFYFISKSYA